MAARPASSGSGGPVTCALTPRITSIANLSFSRRSGRNRCSYNELSHVADTQATPVTPATPVFGIDSPRIDRRRRVARSAFIAAPVEYLRRQYIDALVRSANLSHRLKAVASP